MKTIILGLMGACTCVYGAFPAMETGVRPVGMGGAYTAVSDDAHALFHNPAGLGTLRGTGLGAGLFRPYGLPALSFQAVSLAQGTRYGTLGLGFLNFGRTDYYKEESVLFSWGSRVYKRLLAGITLRYQALRIMPVYGSDWSLAADAGVLVPVNDRLRIGARAANLGLTGLGLDNERVPVNVCAGFALYPFRDAVVAVDVFQEAGSRAELRIGQEITILKYLLVRTGFQTGPARFTVGTSIRSRYMTVEYAFFGHPVLGPSHQAGIQLVYRLKKRKK